MTAINRIDALFGATALADCRSPQIADARSTELVRDTTAGPVAGYWEAQACWILRCYLLAAAFSGADSAQVIAWANHPEDLTAAQVLKDHAADVPADWIEVFESVMLSDGPERSMVVGTMLHAMNPATQRHSAW